MKDTLHWQTSRTSHWQMDRSHWQTLLTDRTHWRSHLIERSHDRYVGQCSKEASQSTLGAMPLLNKWGKSKVCMRPA
eukprot:1151157-Pelagomonas_calceolata.AAC.1